MIRDAVDLALAYRAGELKPRDVVEEALAQVEARNGELNAFAHNMEESARAAADAAGEALRLGQDLGPLHGIPVAVKDLVEVAGAPTGYGSRVLPSQIADRDAQLISRLRNAGAILLGKTNLLEYAYGVAHPEIGQTNNPLDPTRTAGGSSGGSAAAVAAGIVPLAIGTDTGGSIRIPAAYCGIVGMKPTFGLVPLDGVFPLSRSLDHAGPMARTISDAALLLGSLAGRAIPVRTTELRRLKLGVARQHFPREAQNAVVGEVIEGVLGQLVDAGVKLVEIKLPVLDDANAALLDILRPEASVIHRDLYAANPRGYAEGTRRQIEAGLKIPATVYIQAKRRQEVVRAALDKTLESVDVLVSPSVPFLAPHRDPEISNEGDSEILASGLACLTGHPSLSLPAGLVKGLAVGLQLTGRRNGDATLLSIAKAFEDVIRQG